ncbi:hypothetical protein BDR07DRAFT_1379407 [Suillus spraguei]|nr:hypothetical protein BDR07DRAFT_1379407 [Suillus spraguei]
MNARTRACYPRILMIRSRNRNRWVRCADPDIIIHTKLLAIPYRAVVAFTRGPGERVQTLPETLLSSRLCYKFRDREEVKPLSSFELANLAYANSDDEQVIVNAYSRKDLLEKEKAIWGRATAALPIASGLHPRQSTIGGDFVASSEVYKAAPAFYARDEVDLHALARLSLVNDNASMNVSLSAWMYFTPSGSPFSKPEQFTRQRCSEKQYKDANLKDREKSGPDVEHMYTLIDTYSSTMCYFRAKRAPAGACSQGRRAWEVCALFGEVYKEIALRMPVDISQKMELSGWITFG